jgi:hypothetical protein
VPASDVDTVVVDSLKALDPDRPIREADIERRHWNVRFGPIPDMTVVKGWGFRRTSLLTETRQFQFEDVYCPETQSALGGARTGLLQIWGVDRASGSEQAIGRKVRNPTETIWSFDI